VRVRTSVKLENVFIRRQRKPGRGEEDL